MTPQLRSVPERTDESTTEPQVPFGELLGLLGDEYACEILCTLDDGPLAAREIVEHCSMSRPTVYRRLDQLAEAGLVDTRLSLGSDGHHRQEFALAIESAEFLIEADGIDGAVEFVPADD